MSAEQLVTMFYDDTIYSFERADTHSTFTFGGPLEERFSGLPTGPRPLHNLARLALNQIPPIWAVYRIS